ncbi:MAG: class I SAM-dependent methyltransferase [Deferrisomatales bacterium]
MGDWRKFLSPERRRRQPPEALLDRLGSSPGPVLEVGCGPGFWTLPLADRAGGGGWVAAVDPSRPMLRVLRERAGDRPVVPVLARGGALPFRRAAFGRAFAVNVLHEVDDPAAVVADTLRCVGPEGDLVVVDFEARPSPFGPPVERRIPAQRMARWLERAAARVERLDVYADFYVYRARPA